MGEFGVKPSQYVSTYNDPRFVGLTLDALNLEMSKISAMNKDRIQSCLIAENTNQQMARSPICKRIKTH